MEAKRITVDAKTAGQASLPTRTPMRNRRGAVVVPVHVSGWCEPEVQRLGLAARGMLMELMVRFALGYRMTKLTDLAAVCRMTSAEVIDTLADLVQEEIALVVNDEVTLLPGITRALVLGTEKP